MHSASRREFLLLAGPALVAPRFAFSAASSLPSLWKHPYAELATVERSRVLGAAQSYLTQPPRTITSAPAPRSAGGIHDYFSEGDYWWPDPKHPKGPYIRRDGESNPANFIAHRELLLRLSVQMPALTSAWLLTRKRPFADHAVAHLHAWFVDPATCMNPNLQYAQAVYGVDTGRSIGIIDTLHLVEVARATRVLERTEAINAADARGVRGWFLEYLNWMTASERGLQERDEKNNHGSCWLLQAAEFAAYTDNNGVRDQCRERLKTKLLPGQLAPDGSFPLELARTKPYSYSLFNLDILGMSALVLSDKSNDLWNYRLPDGSGLDSAFRFMAPYIEDKQKWPYRHDVEYFDDLPVRQPSLLFAGLKYQRREYLDLWARLDPDPKAPEIIRNHPMRQPLLWVE